MALGTIKVKDADNIDRLIPYHNSGTQAAADSSSVALCNEDRTLLTNLDTKITALLQEAQGNNSLNVGGRTLAGDAYVDNPLPDGARASTTHPTAVDDGDVVALRASKDGRVVSVAHQVRELRTAGQATLTSTLTATDVISAQGATIFGDILSITLVNTSATGTVVEVADEDGNAKWTGYCPPTDMRGIVFGAPWKAAAANKKWQAKTLQSVASVTVSIQIAQEK